MKLLFLSNPAASRRARAVLPRLRAWFTRRVSSFEYCEASAAEELRQRARAAAAEGFDVVLAAGGDGTAHIVLNALRGTQVPLGILPLGHGNDLARALGIPLDPEAAAEFLLRAPVREVDLACVGEEAYAGVAGVGFDAETNERVNAWGNWVGGHLRYFLAALRTLGTFRPPRIELVTDSEEFSGEAMWVAVANGPCYGGGLRIAPEAALDDGVLDICVIERMSRRALLALYPALRHGDHLRAGRVRYFRSSWVEFRAPAGASLYGDGEFLGRLPLRISVAPGALRVLGRKA